MFYCRRNTEVDDSEMKKVIASFTPRILTDTVYPIAPGNLHSTSNGVISQFSSSSENTSQTVAIPIGPNLGSSDYNAPPPPPYLPAYQPSGNDINYPSDDEKNSNLSLENYVGDQDNEISNDNDANTEPLWFHGNIDS